MFDKESDLQTGQKAPTPSPLRASNTLESLRPKEVNVFNEAEQAYGDLAREMQKTDNLPLQGRGLPPIDYEQPSGDFISYDKAIATEHERYRQVGRKANVLPVDWPTASETMDFSLAGRVTKLEEQVDSILDRLAKFSIRASHKI
jgi:hypothetical protein